MMDGIRSISEEQVRDTIQIVGAMETVRKAYLDCDEGKIFPGSRMVMSLGEEKNQGQWLTAVSMEPRLFGTKFSAVFPDNIAIGRPAVQSTIRLYDGLTGEQLAVIGGDHLTAIKTGAGVGVATDLLARKDACRLGIIGTGVQAYAQVLAIQEVRQLEELRIFDMSRERMEDFAGRIRAVQKKGYEIILCESAGACVRGSDIVCTATPSKTPVFDGKDLQPGAHLNAVGSFAPDMQEIDAEAVRRSAVLVTEHVDGLWEAAGDILIPLREGLISRDVVTGSVGDLLAGKIQGRTDDQQITLYESVGSCVLDVAVSIAVYEQCGQSAGGDGR